MLGVGELGVCLRTDIFGVCLVFACARCTRVGARHGSYWRDNSVCPSEEDYIHMVTHKTGGLFRLSVCLMQVLPALVLRAFRPLPRQRALTTRVGGRDASWRTSLPLPLRSRAHTHAGCAHTARGPAGV